MYVCMCVCENACVIIIIIRIDRGVMMKLGIRDAYKYVAATTVYCIYYIGHLFMKPSKKYTTCMYRTLLKQIRI